MISSVFPRRSGRRNVPRGRAGYAVRRDADDVPQRGTG